MSVKLNVASDVTSLTRGLAVIRAFDNFYKPLSLVEISNNISVSFSNTQSICENLVELGYLSKNNSDTIKRTVNNVLLDGVRVVNAEVFVFADVSGSIQGDQTIPLSKRPKLNRDATAR